MEELINILHREECTLVVRCSGKAQRYTQRGVADLIALLQDESARLFGAEIADRAIGKAAAALMIKGGARRVYADVISTPALRLLSKAGVETTYATEVHHIENRNRTDWCPIEKKCRNTDHTEDIITIVTDFIANNNTDKRQNT